jgi:alpha-glucosidase
MKTGRLVVVGGLLAQLSAVWLCADEVSPKALPNGIALGLKDNYVEIRVVTPHAFCLHLSSKPDQGPYTSIFLKDTTGPTPSFTVVNEGAAVGLKTAFGELLVDPVKETWTLRDETGATLTDWATLGKVLPAQAGKPAAFRPVAGVSPTVVKPLYYGAGNTPIRGSLVQPAAGSQMGNGSTTLPQYWSTAGYGVLAISQNANQSPRWQSQDHGHVDWNAPGTGVDLYLMPAHDLYGWLQADAELTGAAPVPPLWSFGYLQSRWGWKDKAYIDETFARFRQDQLPVDAFILDFEWYTPEPDYAVPAAGDSKFVDFGYNPQLLPNPAQQIADFGHQGLHIIGIRKPRLGNSDLLSMARSRGWILPLNPDDPNGGDSRLRDLDYSNAAVRTWWADNNRKFLDAGMPGFWNDEGEVTFTDYAYWNLAENDLLHQVDPKARFWSLNRAFSPGMQRLGAATWTGDIRSTWEQLNMTTGDLLSYSLSGMPYSACDLGGYQGDYKPGWYPELMARWTEAGVFFPIMRSHSDRSIPPHFPWLLGPDLEAVIRKALELRYRLIPFYYSLGHEAYLTGAPIMRPLVMEFPTDEKVSSLTSEWLMGRGLLAAPVLNQGGTRSIYLPNDLWYKFGTNQVTQGPQTINVTAKIDEIPLYVRAGTILPLGPVRQFTGQATDQPLEVQIYPGKDGKFDFVEDDGATLDYQSGNLRTVSFVWNDAAKTLSWKVSGTYTGANLFHAFNAVLFAPQGKIEKPAILDQDGSINFGTQ